MSCLAAGSTIDSDKIASWAVIFPSCHWLDRGEEFTAGLREQQEQCGGRLAFPCEDC